MMYVNETKQEYKMKRVLFSFVFAAIVLSFGLANGMTINASVDPGYFWNDGVEDFIKANTGFTIDINMDNSDQFDRVGMSIPLTFYMTGDVTTFTRPDSGYEGFNGFEEGSPWWGSWYAWTLIDWDGNPDTINWTGAGSVGIAAGTGMDLRFKFKFQVAMVDTSHVSNICVDSCSIPGQVPPGKYDWLFDEPSPPFGGPYCWNVKKMPNMNAEITNCPVAEVSLQWDDQYALTLTATEDEGDTPYTYHLASGVGELDGADYEYNPNCQEVGAQSAVLGVHDTEHVGDFNDNCTINFMVLNTDPVIGGDCDATITVGKNKTKTADFTATDDNVGDVLTFSISDDGGAQGAYGIAPTGPGAATLTFTPNDDDADKDITFTVRVTDCNGDFDECDVIFHVISIEPFGIGIGDVFELERALVYVSCIDAMPGYHSYVDVFKFQGSERMHGFDFLIGYDNSALTFVGASADPEGVVDDYGWEYFTFRYSWNGNCGNACPTGLLRVVAMAEINNGVPGGDLMLSDPSILFVLDFLVTNNWLLGGYCVPINFYWMDCGDNAIAFSYRSDPETMVLTALADTVWYYTGNMHVLPAVEPFPTYSGPFHPDEHCFDIIQQDPPKYPVPFIYFWGGCICIEHPSEIDDRGDVNLNGVGYEIADAVVFTNYFIYGMNAFQISQLGQSAATDVNADGIALTVADLVYLIRVITGDAMAIPYKVSPLAKADVVANGNVVSIDAEIGAAQFVFAGDVSVSLAEGAAGMELISNYDGTNTFALVYSFEKGRTASGDIVYANGGLISVDAADYNGYAYKTAVLPAEFGLKSYPNPFNPAATIEMQLPVATDWTISIFNVAGQRVADFSGYSEAGVVSFEWDASDQASGIYFFKAEAGVFSATKKMVLLK